MSNFVLSLFPGLGLLDLAFEAEGFCVVRGPDVIWGGDVRRFHPPKGKLDGVIGGPPCQAFSQLSHLVRANGHEPKFGNLIPEFERCVLEADPDWFLMENVRAAPVPFGDFGGGPTPERQRYGINTFLLDNSALNAGEGFGEEQQRVRRITFGLRGKQAPCLMRWIDLATFLLPDAQRAGSGLTRPVGNTPEAKGRVPAGNGGHQDLNESLTAVRKARRQAVLSDPSAVPVKIGGSGKVKRTVHGGHGQTPSARDEIRRVGAGTGSDGGPCKRMGRFRLADALRLQGLPPDFLDHCPFTAEGKLKAVANGVPVMMGRALARAVMQAIEP